MNESVGTSENFDLMILHLIKIGIYLTLFIFQYVCQYYVSVLPCLQKSPPICVCQVHSDLFRLHLQPLNKPCACLKMKKKKKHLRGITLQGF